MITLEQVVFVIPMFALAASITYYALVLKNQNKTRQAQLFMQIYNRWLDPEFLRLYVRSYQMDYEDLDNFNMKYSTRTQFEERLPYTIMSFYYEGIGMLVEHGFIDPKLVIQLAEDVREHWEMFSPMILERRERTRNPLYFHYTESLYNNLYKIRKNIWEHREKMY